MSEANEAMFADLPPDPGVGGVEHTAFIPTGQVPADLPRHLRDRLAEAPVVGQRSEQTAALVVAAVEWGYDDGQVIALALEHRPTREKYGSRADRRPSGCSTRSDPTTSTSGSHATAPAAPTGRGG